MTNAHPKTSSPPRRRPVAWRDLHIDRSEPWLCAPAPSEWPQIAIRVPTPANDNLTSEERWVSQKVLADRLMLSVATLARHRKKGWLRGSLVGSQWRFSEQQIADYLKRTEKPLCLYGKHLNDNDPT